MGKRIMAIDLETYSSIDLTKAGVYRYTEAEDFAILLFGYAFDDGPVQLVDIAQGEDLPDDAVSALIDPNVIKTAYNANFERVCLTRHFEWPVMHPAEQWQCTAVLAATLGLPRHLEGVAQSMKLKAQKDTAGKNLIRYFSVPCKPTKANNGRTRNLPEHDLEKWEQFKRYCKQDVEVERTIRKRLEKFQPSGKEHRLWCLDQVINDTGVGVDKELVDHALKCDAQFQKRLSEKATDLTGLDNPGSVSQLKDWLAEEGIEVDSLNKETVATLVEEVENETVQQVLEMRQNMAKTSIKKYEAIDRALCDDGRVRGLLQFYGANRTGRWAGRLVQVQNLPQNKIPDLNYARALLRSGDYETLELLYDSIPVVLSQLIRTAFVPSPGGRFIVADFSAIEARIIAWLAGEKWRMDVFQSHGKIYEASAAQMFSVPIETIDKGNPLRQKGKIAELALGYGGSVGALKAMGALKMGLEESELPELVSAWRDANPAITQLWWEVGGLALEAVQDKTTVRSRAISQSLEFSYSSGVLWIQLPSGRSLAYARPQIETDPKYGKPSLTYEGLDAGKWGRVNTYGPKLVENIVQAIARDCLAEAMLRLADAGYRTVMHVHDEVVLDMPKDSGSLEDACRIMGQPIDWAKGLPLRADGFECEYYQKD